LMMMMACFTRPLEHARDWLTTANSRTRSKSKAKAIENGVGGWVDGWVGE